MKLRLLPNFTSLPFLLLAKNRSLQIQNLHFKTLSPTCLKSNSLTGKERRNRKPSFYSTYSSFQSLGASSLSLLHHTKTDKSSNMATTVMTATDWGSRYANVDIGNMSVNLTLSLEPILISSPRIECANCCRKQFRSRFSNNQLSKFQESTYKARRGGQPAELPRCRDCTAGNTIELKCAGCYVVKGLEFFAKQQRKNPDNAVSKTLLLLGAVLISLRNATNVRKILSTSCLTSVLPMKKSASKRTHHEIVVSIRSRACLTSRRLFQAPTAHSLARATDLKHPLELVARS